MDKLRHSEHVQFLEDKAEMENGIEGIKLALKVLREYYAQQGAAHDKAEGVAGGVIGLLEVIESDFVRGLRGTLAAEATAQAEYEKQTKENEVENVMKEQDVKYKEQELAQLARELPADTRDHESARAELDAILAQRANLKDMCVPNPVVENPQLFDDGKTGCYLLENHPKLNQALAKLCKR
eukprot:NODE_14789_length_1086_cov_3.664234.p1 GENE.NODE_14789_length_1086_cov_3.664234~~NODE_14789_length_1086_cov_3.664234.p1  ORF type:complete len:182 (-),score=43.90 NODE_14789_length_1086_cov_3.664234:140-685(-)